MKLINTLAGVACASLLFASVIGSPRHAYAQDADSDSAYGSTSDAKGNAGDIAGCWSGNAGDLDDDVQFNFEQSGKKILPSSTFSFTFVDDGNTTVSGVIKGSVSGNKIKFSGSMGKHCKLKGSGEANDLGSPSASMEGPYKFSGKCGSVRNGNFSISPSCPK